MQKLLFNSNTKNLVRNQSTIHRADNPIEGRTCFFYTFATFSQKKRTPKLISFGILLILMPYIFWGTSAFSLSRLLKIRRSIINHLLSFVNIFIIQVKTESISTYWMLSILFQCKHFSNLSIKLL